jgi:hypothetical protein
MHNFGSPRPPEAQLLHNFGSPSTPRPKHNICTTLAPPGPQKHNFCTTLASPGPQKHNMCTTLVSPEPQKHNFCTTLGSTGPQKHNFCTTWLPSPPDSETRQEAQLLHNFAHTNHRIQKHNLHNFATSRSIRSTTFAQLCALKPTPPHNLLRLMHDMPAHNLRTTFFRAAKPWHDKSWAKVARQDLASQGAPRAPGHSQASPSGSALPPSLKPRGRSAAKRVSEPGVASNAKRASTLSASDGMASKCSPFDS